jgi:putative sterol carrier protein
MNELPVIKFKYGLNEDDEYEMSAKGWRGDVVVKCPNGKEFNLFFYDPVRLAQTVEDDEIVYEQGLTIVKEVTRGNIEKAVVKMWNEGFFDKLKEI